MAIRKRAEHAAIKAKVDSGLSLEAAILRYVLETAKLDELQAQMRTSGGVN